MNAQWIGWTLFVSLLFGGLVNSAHMFTKEGAEERFIAFLALAFGACFACWVWFRLH